MQTLFGLPLFGSLFTPILITLVSVLLYKTFFRISKVEISNEPMNIKPVDIKDSLENDETKTTVKKKKKKACSGKKGGKGCCSDKNGIIDITKVFVESSSLTKDHSESLTNLWSSDNLNVEVVPLNSDTLEAQLKEETGSVSLSVFLLDKNEEKPVLRPWLDSVSKRSPTSEKLLAGFKYSVFVANGNDKDLIHLETDRALHRLGGVRVSKAGILDFSTWSESLSRTVSKWNESGKKGCKCGPTSDSSNEHEGEHSSCSGSCSSSEDDAPAPPAVLDLEDLGKALS